VPAASPLTVAVTPVPVNVTAPGFRVNVHVPVTGKPLRSTLPVANVQVGCVIVPTTGAVGVEGCVLITTLAEATEVQVPLLTVNVYVPAASPLTVVVVPVPVEVTAPGLSVSVQVPVAGKPLNATLPVATVQVGCVIVPITGAFGAPGAALITTLADATEVQVPSLTVNV
jgi:hypothetical protein